MWSNTLDVELIREELSIRQGRMPQLGRRSEHEGEESDFIGFIELCWFNIHLSVFT